MQIRVMFFASLRETVGKESLRVALHSGDQGASNEPAFDELRSALVAKLGASADALWADNVRIAHNQVLQADVSKLALEDGDEVAFLPPVTGG